MSKKMNLKNLTMAFATAAAVPAPTAEVDVEATRAMVTQKIAEIKQKKVKQSNTADTDSEPKVAKEPKVTKEPKVKSAAKIKEPKAPKTPKPAKVVAEGEEKTFTVAGCSTFEGVTKVRFANDLVSRIKILTKVGHTDIRLFEMPQPMTKAEIVEYLKAHPELNVDAIALANKEDSITVGNKKSALTTPAE